MKGAGLMEGEWERGREGKGGGGGEGVRERERERGRENGGIHVKFLRRQLQSKFIYGVATISRLFKIVSLFCRISSLL